jgi:hypothetical protein
MVQLASFYAANCSSPTFETKRQKWWHQIIRSIAMMDRGCVDLATLPSMRPIAPALFAQFNLLWNGPHKCPVDLLGWSDNDTCYVWNYMFYECCG